MKNSPQTRQHYRCGILLILMQLFVFAPTNNLAAETNREIIGRIENARIAGTKLRFKARIDTGAGVSSVNARVIEIIESKKPKKRDTVVFDLEDSNGKKKRFKLPIEKWQRIKGKGDVPYYRRPVVRLSICLGSTQVGGRVNLADRSRMLYPLLIGRNILKGGRYLIDPRAKFKVKPACDDDRKAS